MKPADLDAGNPYVMAIFQNNGIEISFIDEGAGSPIVLVHGFGSTHVVNWIGPGWVKTLTGAGYRVLAFDNRGHGASSKSYRSADYHPSLMASDAVALMDHAGVERAHVMGYSMGARISAFLALEHGDRVHSLIFGGLGLGMVEGVGDWDVIADAILAADPSTIADARGRMFRLFADQTSSDKKALAACIETSRKLISAEEMATVTQPTLVAAGTLDDISGSASKLAGLMPNAVSFDIPDRDHMLSVGDRLFKARTLEFLAENAF